MKYAKLVQIQKKVRLYSRITTITLVIACILLLLHVILRVYDVANPIIIEGVFGITVVLFIVNLVCMGLARKQNRFAEDYFVIRIMEILNEQGIESNQFEIIDEGNYYYRVGFHNQMVDYDKLQAIIDAEVVAMCRFMKQNMRVKLI